MDRVDELRHLLRKDEYAEAEKYEQSLQEASEEYHKAISKRFYDKQAPLRLIKTKCDFTKEVMCECMCNLYESALIIDDVEKYSDVLRDAMKKHCMSIMENANSNSELEKLFENASPYVKGMINLAESAWDNKSDEEIKEYENKIILSKDDMDLINKFETSEGKDVYASDLQDRVIDVYKTEEKLGSEQKEKVQAVVDELSKLKSSTEEDKNDSNSVTESIEFGCNLFNNTPKTIFNAIFINKSKSYMNESASVNLEENSEKILAETIATYTLLETVHALGFKTYTDEEKANMRMEFFIS